MKKLPARQKGIYAAVITAVLATVLYTVNSALAQTYHVSTAGNDTNFGTSASPFRTIRHCTDIANTGDTCSIGAGTYAEAITVRRDGIALVAQGKVNMMGFDVEANNVLIRGFTITNANANAGIRTFGNFITVENNDISKTLQDGIWFFGHDNVFRGNYIHDILANDLYPSYDEHADCFQTFDWSWDTYNVLFENNVCDHNRTVGSNQSVMLSGSRVHDLTFRGNRFIMRDAGYSPLALYGGTGFLIENNYFCNSTGQGTPAIYLAGGTNVTLKNNTQIGFNNLVQGSGVTSQTGTIQGTLPCVVFSATGSPTPIPPSITPSKTATPSLAPVTASPSRTPTIRPTITRKPTSTKVPTRTVTPIPVTLIPITVTGTPCLAVFIGPDFIGCYIPSTP